MLYKYQKPFLRIVRTIYFIINNKRHQSQTTVDTVHILTVSLFAIRFK